MAADGGGRTGGQMVVDALLAYRVARVFGVPGESYLPILDALYDVSRDIQLITCRHEHGAAMMAEAHAKLDGKPGVCLVTRGPGACNAAIGVHTAFQDSTPMLLLVGQVERGFLGREAFQEVDVTAMFRPLAKSVRQTERTADLPEAMAEAFHSACSGRPGPVVLALPEDLLAQRAVAATVPPLARDLPPSDLPPPDRGLMERLHRVLGDAHRPVMLLGGGGWSAAARADILAFAEANALPTCCGFRRNDVFDNDHACYAGELGIGANPALVERIRSADLLLAVGTRLGEATSQGYSLPLGARHSGGPELVHVHPDPHEPGRVFAAALAIPATAPLFAATARRLTPTRTLARAAWMADARADFLADTQPVAGDGPLDLGQVMMHLRAVLPADAIVTVDAGNFSGWPQRFLRFGGGRRLLGATNGAMGYGVPAAVAAKLRHPERMVVACAGDGGFGMTGQELTTAIHHGAAIIVLVFDNAMYGTIRMHQERGYPGRVIGTALTNPDFVAVARACGAHGERVERTEDFAAGFARAADANRPALIELHCNPEQITTRTTLSRLRGGI